MRLTSKTYKRARIYAAIGAVGFGLLACVTPPLETPTPQTHGTDTVYVSQNIKNKVDVLFMVDNSRSMAPMSTELRNRMAEFLDPFVNLAKNGTYADMHIGVVTSDYGAGMGSPGCDPSPGGQRGILQNTPITSTTPCLSDKFIKVVFNGDANAGYVDGNVSNVAANALSSTFSCMATVVTDANYGCGFEHQLESVYAALHNNVENAGFLRDDALLTVVFLANEDDGSGPPNTDLFNADNASKDKYGSSWSYARSTRFGIRCCPPGQSSCNADQLAIPPYGSSNGPLANCQPAPNLPLGAGPGMLYDVKRYIDFFTKTARYGGVKNDPLDVVLVGIDAPESPVEVMLGDPIVATNGEAQVGCSPLDENLCVPVLKHSCQNATNSAFFGDPAVRLNTVIRAAQSHNVSSICETSYAAAMTTAASKIASVLAGGCLEHALPTDGSGNLQMDCTVSDITTNSDGTQTIVPVAQCPNNTAGTGSGSSPCWIIETKDACTTLSPQGVGLTVDRGVAEAPANTKAMISCVYAN